MSLYVQRRCWRCKEILERYTSDYRAIGIPYCQCSHCGAYNRYNHINEWDLKGFFGKASYIAVVAWTTILYAMVAPVVAWGAAYLFGWDQSNKLFFYSYAVGLILMTSVNIWLFVSDTRKSRERLKDQQYLDTLRRLQII